MARYACPVDSFFETFRRTWSEKFGTSPPPPRSWTNSLSGTGQAFCVIKLQWNLAWSLVSIRPVSELLLPHTVVIGFMPYPLLRAVSVSMTSPFVLRWVCSWGAVFAFHMRGTRRCPRLACLHLQMGAWPNHQISGSERRHRKGVCIRWGPSHQRAHRVGKARWQATRRPDANPVAARQALTWDITVAHMLADSHVSVTARSDGAAAVQAAGRKSAKYDVLVQTTDSSRDAWPPE